jgi:molybdopterin adenylyltransferase
MPCLRLKKPILTQTVFHVDLRHSLNERREVCFVEVLADAPDAIRDLGLRSLERDGVLELPSSHHVCVISQTTCPSRADAAKGRLLTTMRVAILTVSTAGARGERKGGDTSGDAIAAWVREHNHTLARRELVSDEVNAIVRHLLEWCDGEYADLVLTTGGTGLSPTDVTPEATQTLIERDAPGIAEWLRVNSVNNFPKAALSRGRSGVRNKTLIVNLPGSPGGVKDALAALDPIIDHAVAVLRGEVKHHDSRRPM